MIDRFWCGCVLTVLLVATGCGGGEAKGPSLDQQLTKAKAVADPAIRAKQLAPLGEKQLQAGDVINGDSTLKFAYESAMEVEDPSSKANALIAVGQSMGRAGKTTEAKKALREQGKSLLLPGVARAEGEFQPGDVVSICDLDGTEFARGMTDVTSESIRLKQISRQEAVHRDNLVIL